VTSVDENAENISLLSRILGSSYSRGSERLPRRKLRLTGSNSRRTRSIGRVTTVGPAARSAATPSRSASKRATAGEGAAKPGASPRELARRVG
jgi:hypothetical protein